MTDDVTARLAEIEQRADAATARHVVWLKNQVAPRSARAPWRDCSATGYPSDTPPWLATWLMIIADNTIHLLINTAAIAWLHSGAVDR